MSHNHTDNIKIKDQLYTFYIRFHLCDNGYGQSKNKFYEELFNYIKEFEF